MTFVMVDVEADGPCPGLYSMVSFGAVVVDQALDKTFFSKVRAITQSWVPEALTVSGYTREETLAIEFPHPIEVMPQFAKWLQENVKDRPIFISDNNGFDWQFINYYFHLFCDSNPFGFSSYNLNSLYKGIVRDTTQSFKHLRKTKHTHHPVDDAKGNAEALLHMKNNMRLRTK